MRYDIITILPALLISSHIDLTAEQQRAVAPSNAQRRLTDAAACQTHTISEWRGDMADDSHKQLSREVYCSKHAALWPGGPGAS